MALPIPALTALSFPSPHTLSWAGSNSSCSFPQQCSWHLKCPGISILPSASSSQLLASPLQELTPEILTLLHVIYCLASQVVFEIDEEASMTLQLAFFLHSKQASYG
jgi:hypothetical protein